MTHGLPPLSNGPDVGHFLPPRFGSPGLPAQFGIPAPLSPPRQPPSPGRFLVVVLVVIGLVAAVLQTLPVFDTALSEPAGSRTGTAAGTAPSFRPGDPLTDSKIYPMQVKGSCPAARSVTTREAYEAQVSSLIDCLAGIFKPLVNQAGGNFEAAKHKFYGRSTSSPCGSEQDAYAFYCTRDATLYFSDQVFEDSQYGRLMIADVVIHEYGHHVQAMMGMFEAADGLSEEKAITTRREELQVFCWTYYVFANVESYELSAADHSYFRDVWSHTDDPVGHGSVKAQQYWGARGLNGTDLGACNTWKEPASRVR